jgi:hypothetical protein
MDGGGTGEIEALCVNATGTHVVVAGRNGTRCHFEHIRSLRLHLVLRVMRLDDAGVLHDEQNMRVGRQPSLIWSAKDVAWSRAVGM